MYGLGEAIVRVGTFVKGEAGWVRFARGGDDAVRDGFSHLPGIGVAGRAVQASNWPGFG